MKIDEEANKRERWDSTLFIEKEIDYKSLLESKGSKKKDTCK